MKKLVVLFVILIMSFGSCLAISTSDISAEEAMLKLEQGNNRFISLKMKHPDSTKKRRLEMLKGQHPFVVILSCSDSRVPPELIFDQGLGDIFEIRNAGNVLDEHIIGSIEYAVMHCGVKLIVKKYEEE